MMARECSLSIRQLCESSKHHVRVLLALAVFPNVQSSHVALARGKELPHEQHRPSF